MKGAGIKRFTKEQILLLVDLLKKKSTLTETCRKLNTGELTIRMHLTTFSVDNVYNYKKALEVEQFMHEMDAKILELRRQEPQITIPQMINQTGYEKTSIRQCRNYGKSTFIPNWVLKKFGTQKKKPIKNKRIK